MHIKDKVALITGAARGIGKAFAVALLEKGAKVAIADIRDEAGKETAEELCLCYGDRAIFVRCDVTKADDCKDAFRQTKEQLGQVELLVNNAGMQSRNMEDWEKLISVNVAKLGSRFRMSPGYLGTFQTNPCGSRVATLSPPLTSVITMTTLGMTLMSRDQGGNGGIIVNISSIAGLDVCVGAGLYTATKHAVTGFTRTMALNCKEKPESGLKVFGLAPCWVKTDMTTRWHQNLDAIKTQSPSVYKFIQDIGGFVEPQVIADGLISLVTDEPGNEDFLLVTGLGKKYIDFRQLYSSLVSSS